MLYNKIQTALPKAMLKQSKIKFITAFSTNVLFSVLANVSHKINLKFITAFSTDVLNVSYKTKLKFITAFSTCVLNVTIQDKIKFVSYKTKLKFTYVLNVTYKIKLSLFPTR